MIRQHRKVHRLVWLLLVPLLLGLILAFSRPYTELSPANDHLTELPGATSGATSGNIAGKGALP